VPVLVALAPPEVLQAAPELMRRISWRRVDSDSVENCWTILRNAPCKRSGNCSLFAPNGAEVLTPNGAEELTPNCDAACVGPSMGTIEASGVIEASGIEASSFAVWFGVGIRFSPS